MTVDGSTRVGQVFLLIEISLSISKPPFPFLMTMVKRNISKVANKFILQKVFISLSNFSFNLQE